MSTVLTIIYSFLIPIIYILYLKGVRKRGTTPSPLTWAIWTVAGLINIYTYYSVVDGDILKYAVAVIVAVCSSSMFIYSMIAGKFKRLNVLDYILGLIVVFVLIYWFFESDNRKTNLLLQVVYLVSFIPTVYNILYKNAQEYLPPFVIAVIVYSLSIMVILLNWTGDWLELAYPIVNGVIGNGSVVSAILSRKGKILIPGVLTLGVFLYGKKDPGLSRQGLGTPGSFPLILRTQYL